MDSWLLHLSSGQDIDDQIKGLLQPLPIHDHIWEDLSIDFIVSLPQSGGYDSILVIVEQRTKDTHFISLSSPLTALSVAKAFSKNIVKHHSVPRSIVSDRDPAFLSKFWQDLFKLQGTPL